jgi:hypothetical protein
MSYNAFLSSNIVQSHPYFLHLSLFLHLQSTGFRSPFPQSPARISSASPLQSPSRANNLASPSRSTTSLLQLQPSPSPTRKEPENNNNNNSDNNKRKIRDDGIVESNIIAYSERSTKKTKRTHDK